MAWTKVADNELWYEKLRIKWYNFSTYNKSKLELQTYGLRHTRNFLYHVLAFRAFLKQLCNTKDFAQVH